MEEDSFEITPATLAEIEEQLAATNPLFNRHRREGRKMNTVKVKTSALLETLRTNRTAHRDTFEKAVVGYRKAAVAEIEGMLSDAREGRRIRRSVTLIEPMDQTKDYDRVIKMLEMSVDAEMEISEGEFAQYVCDDWAWKNQFRTSTMSYVQ